MTDKNRKYNLNGALLRLKGSLAFINGRRPWVIATSAAAVLIVLVALLSMKSAGSAAAFDTSSTFTTRRDDLIVTVVESGSLKARNTIDVMSMVEGEVTIISIIPEGTYITEEDVNEGKLLVELDSSTLREQLPSRQIDYAAADASYTQTKEAYDIQLNQNESDIATAELTLKFSLMDFEKYLSGKLAQDFLEDVNLASISTEQIAKLLDDPNLGGSALQSLKEYQDNIALANSNYERAADNLTWTRKLYEKGYVSDTERRADELEVESLRMRKEQAEMTLELFKRYDFAKDGELLLSNYTEAQRELERTKARARSQSAQKLALLKSAEAEFELQKDRLAKTKKQIEACTIKAPAPGLVVYSSSGDYSRRRDRPIEEGGTVYERQKIISLPDTSEMMVEIAVHESSVNKVRPGQRATITMESFPDETFTGEVLKVSPLPDPQRGWLSPDLKVYTTQVSIEGSPESLRPGMSAKVEILVDELYDVLIVPVQVVANREGKKECLVMTSRGPQRREVTTGAFNNTFAQIINGLEEGDEVLLNPPRMEKEPGQAGSKQKREDKRQQDGESEQGSKPTGEMRRQEGVERQSGDTKSPQRS